VTGFVLALWGALSSLLPIVNLAGDVLALLGLILAVIDLARSSSKGGGRSLSIAAITLAVFAFTISIMVNIAAAAVVHATPTAPQALESPVASTTGPRPALSPADHRRPGPKEHGTGTVATAPSCYGNPTERS
jgi:hypothetical protein